MSAATKALEHAEHIEHAGHAGQHGGSKLVGLTMGLIGVLIALCAALVGGQRNEMSRVMIEQTQATADATSASTKYRMVMIDIEHLRAEPAATLNPALRSRFVQLYEDYAAERKLTWDWASSYEQLVDAHFEAAEGYEHAQLIAEVAIVFASLAVLLASRPAWLLSLVLAAGSVGQVGFVYAETRAMVAPRLAAIEHFRDAYRDVRHARVEDHSDQDAVDALDPDHTIRNGLAAAAKAK